MNTLSFKLNSAQSASKSKLIIGIFMIFSLVVAVHLSLFIVLYKYNLSFSFQKDWLNVHLIPHSHNDVGWLKTPEDYYETNVRYILDNVIFELQRNSLRKFVYAETYFFWKWWQEQTDEVRKQVRTLINDNQLEIIGGGLCMSDEAVTHYQSFIDQSTWGFRLLNDTFGPNICPTVAWQIDTFGHSKGFASLFAQMGFDSLFFSRLDIKDQIRRRNKKAMEFVWWGNKNLGESSSIFTSIFYNHYCAPKGFDFEEQQDEVPINFTAFSVYVRKHAKAFKTNNILVPMGDDFRYLNAKKYFDKMDKLIRFFNKNIDFKLKVFYSTPSSYIYNLSEANLVWPEKKGDFFPYAAESYAYWTGFFTSRPCLKYFERVSNNFLQISKQLLVFANKGMQYFNELSTLREALGILQHHDAITGTSQQHVADHYAKLLYDGINNCAGPVDLALGNLSVLRGTFQRPAYQSCLLLNISSCNISENYPRFVVTVYNPLSRKVNHYVRVPVTGRDYSVLTKDGTQVLSQMVNIPNSVRNIPGRKSIAKTELVFFARNIPAVGFKSYYIQEQKHANFKKPQKAFGSSNLKPTFDNRSRLLTGFITNSENISLVHRIKFYPSKRNWSGAYLFGPTTLEPINVGNRVTTKLLNSGVLVKEYEQTFSDWASQIIRVYNNEDFAEFEWLIGPIPVDDLVGKEIVSTYSSNIKSDNIYYTDVNGMEMQKRIRNYREWSGKMSKTVAGNYYPVTTMISIHDDYNQMYIVVDRPQGGASLQSGEVELMVHRRLEYDDGRGVTEPLNEMAYGVGLIVRGRHWLLFGKKELRMNQKAKLFAQMRHSAPWLFFFEARSLTFEDWRSNYITEFSGLHNYIPRNVKILTLEPWRENTILLRLEHIFEKAPVSSLANAPVIIYLRDLFKTFEVLEARETALGADRWLSDVNRLKWRLAAKVDTKEDFHDERVNNLTITLKPQQIRTFIVKIRAKNA